MNDHVRDPDASTGVGRLVDFIQARFLSIVGLLAVGGGLAMIVGFDVQVPRFWKIVGLSGAIVLPYGYVVGNKVVSMLYNPNYIFLVDLDARYLDGALYRFPYTDFKQLESRKGSFTQLTPNLYTAKDVDLEAMKATGTWRGTLDDPELLRALQAVHECRGQLEDDARRGFVLETSAFTIIRNAVRETTLSVVRTFEEGSLPDGGQSLHNAIEDQLESFDLDDSLDDLVEEADLSPEEAETDPDDLDPDGDLGNGRTELTTDE
ncbi:hypothetical protein [Halobellus ordinarius]|uniref:hypothetical protein n=1 Tax=Halobellus ordinarius TaxID=3075120 RepID=UPI0028801C0E|nr:hypothetical protein [Halobellus sp. ZY16]